jgi:hypothetical protein
MNIILDRVAVWLPQNVDGLLVRKAPPTTAYLTKDSLVYKQATQPLYRYVKNYEVGRGKDRVKFCLFVRSFEKDEKVVEAVKGLKEKAKEALDKTDIDEKIVEGAKGIVDKIGDLFNGKE